mgnify:CR=1 FL=1
MKVTVKYFYKEIEYVTTMIWRLGLTNRLIEAAKQQDFEKINLIVKEFKEHQPELWNRMCELYNDYSNEIWPTIFGNDKYEYYVYDSSKINPLNIICCCALSNTDMNPDTLFDDHMILKIALQEEGYFEFADYIEKDEFSELSDLVKAYKKE